MRSSTHSARDRASSTLAMNNFALTAARTKGTIKRSARASLTEFHDDTYTWTVKWNMTVPGATYENTVDNRAWT